MCKIAAIALVMGLPGLLFGQVMDFDSLYHNDEVFRKHFHESEMFKGLYKSDDIMQMTIESNFKKLIKEKYREEYQPAAITYRMNDTIQLQRNIKIKTRGNFRKRECFNPPIKLNFKEAEVNIPELKEFDKLKLVGNCKSGKQYEQYVLSEYLVYKLFNLISEYSFRVRLIRMKYIDSSGKFNPRISYAFIIENKDQVASRLNATIDERVGIPERNIDPPSLATLNLFQYMIGNVDWSVPASHNVVIIRDKDYGTLRAVPYDFDYAGIVNAHYAIPAEEYGIKSVTERLYRGKCLDADYVQKVIQKYQNMQEELLDHYRATTLIDEKNRKTTIKYLEDFYTVLNNEKLIDREIMAMCR
jgi:hypothetical protein